MSHLWCVLYGCFVSDVEEIVGEENMTCDSICLECEDCSKVVENGRLIPVMENNNDI